jgi:hypothetical protein
MGIMMNRQELIDNVTSGRQVTIQLTDAEVVSTKRDLRRVNHYRAANLYKVVVVDPVFGSVFFSSFSDKIGDINRGEKVSLKVTVTGVGEPSERYPDPILFAKPLTRQRDAVTIARPVVEYASDLPNV